MKRLQFLFSISVISLLWSGPAFSEEPEELKQLRFEFEVDLAELSKPVQELNEKYRGYLEKQKAAYQQEGKLPALLEVEEELESFEKELSKELSTFPELKRLQGIYRQQLGALTKNGLSDRKLALVQLYRKKSGGLAAEWTKAGKIEEAKLALAESERFAAMEKEPELVKVAAEKEPPKKFPESDDYKMIWWNGKRGTEHGKEIICRFERLGGNRIKRGSLALTIKTFGRYSNTPNDVFVLNGSGGDVIGMIKGIGSGKTKKIPLTLGSAKSHEIVVVVRGHEAMHLKAFSEGAPDADSPPELYLTIE